MLAADFAGGADAGAVATATGFVVAGLLGGAGAVGFVEAGFAGGAGDAGLTGVASLWANPNTGSAGGFGSITVGSSLVCATTTTVGTGLAETFG